MDHGEQIVTKLDELLDKQENTKQKLYELEDNVKTDVEYLEKIEELLKSAYTIRGEDEANLIKKLNDEFKVLYEKLHNIQDNESE